jgi:hypothetical protein
MDFLIDVVLLVCSSVFCLAFFVPRRLDEEEESAKLEKQLRLQELSDEYEARS